MKVQENDSIKVEYTGKLADGTVFDSSDKHGKPLEFKAGTSQVIKGFDEAVLGMEKGEEKTIDIPSENAYGPRRDELVSEVPKDQLPQDQEVQTGMTLAVKAPNGQEFPAVVTKVEDTSITIDMNPPLAGKDLQFELKIVDIQRE